MDGDHDYGIYSEVSINGALHEGGCDAYILSNEIDKMYSTDNDLLEIILVTLYDNEYPQYNVSIDYSIYNVIKCNDTAALADIQSLLLLSSYDENAAISSCPDTLSTKLLLYRICENGYIAFCVYCSDPCLSSDASSSQCEEKYLAPCLFPSYM